MTSAPILATRSTHARTDDRPRRPLRGARPPRFHSGYLQLLQPALRAVRLQRPVPALRRRAGAGTHLTAWRVLLEVGGATAGSPVRRPVDLLAQLDGDVAARFPRAMDFVRPAFDRTPPEAAESPLCW